MGWKAHSGLTHISQMWRILPLQSSRRPLFFEAFHTQEFPVFGRANLNLDFFPTARTNNLIQFRTARTAAAY
jgi:hypothetical protein